MQFRGRLHSPVAEVTVAGKDSRRSGERLPTTHLYSFACLNRQIWEMQNPAT
jgi:hypothetical protein